MWINFKTAFAILPSVLLLACQSNQPNNTVDATKLITQSNISVAESDSEFESKPELESEPKYAEFVIGGDQLPLSSIVDIRGEQIDLTDPQKTKLVILFATWCSDSNRALKALNQSPLLYDSSIEIIAIAREEDVATVKAWRDEHQINVPLAVDPDRSIYQRFAAGGIPRIITVGRDNRIIKMNLAEGENQLSLIQWK